MKNQSEGGQTISLPDGRLLGYLVVGEGKPVFWFHGFPSSRLEVLFLKGIASSKHLQVIGVDRPGFGLSTLLHACKREYEIFIINEDRGKFVKRFSDIKHHYEEEHGEPIRDATDIPTTLFTRQKTPTSKPEFWIFIFPCFFNRTRLVSKLNI